MAWGKVGTETLSAAGDIDLSAFTSTKFNVLLSWTIPESTYNQSAYRFGNGSIDTGNNYAERYSRDGGTDGTATSQSDLDLWANTSTPQFNQFNVSYIINIATEEKLEITFGTDQNTAGASNAPRRIERVGKWANTSNQFDYARIYEKNGGAEDMASDSNLTILGSDLTPASATSIETGSIYIDTDTASRWWYDGTYWNMQPTFEDDFSSYANQTTFDASWVTSDTTKFRGNPSNDNVDILHSNSYDNIYYDLTSVSDTKWLCRFKVTLTTAGSRNLGICYFYIGTTTGDANESQSGLGFYFYDNANYTYALADNGNRPDQTSVTGDLGINPSATTYYAEMKRTSATSFTVTLYSDSSYSTSLGTSTLTINSGITGLRYFKIMGYNTTNGLIGTLDDFKFYNGVTSVQE